MMHCGIWNWCTLGVLQHIYTSLMHTTSAALWLTVASHECHGVSYQQYLHCLLTLFRLATKKYHGSISVAFRKGNPPVTSRLAAQRASNAEIISMLWRQHNCNMTFGWHLPGATQWSHKCMGRICTNFSSSCKCFEPCALFRTHKPKCLMLTLGLSPT